MTVTVRLMTNASRRSKKSATTSVNTSGRSAPRIGASRTSASTRRGC
jgi:hypothetical protein